MNKDDIYNHFKEIGAYKENMPTKEMDVLQNQWFNNNYNAWDVSYLSDDNTTNLLGDDLD
ncbi:MAG TPA: hypothetical protein LFV92_07905 [Rickettsia endosymbiont of Ceroptres masudai]|nr:hypothetical protein [Rickettsia endosymbiont of Ceroptres masudai]